MNGKNVITVTDKEFDLLIQTLFLGNWVINSCRPQEQLFEEYDILFDKITGAYEKSRPDSQKVKKDIDKYLYSLTEKHMDFYHDAIFFDLLSKKLAAYKFPINFNDADALLKAHKIQQIAKRAYEKEFAENGLANLEFNIPGLKEQLEAANKT